jgi:sRNA-binding protein
LQGIQTVAGDIPETLLFRYTVGNYTKVVQEEYKNQFDLKQKEEQAKAEAEAAAASSSAAAAATKTTAFYVRPTNPADKDTTYTVQSQDAPKSENENPAYGISSSSIQNSVFAGLGLLSYFLL